MRQDQALREKFGFEPPLEYRTLCERGCFENDAPDYLWLHEAEWLQAEDILEHRPASPHQDGFIPFALTEGGDAWCWSPSRHPTAVIHCPHDSEVAQFDTPSFSGFLFRRALDHACGGFGAADEAQAREYLRGWADTFQGLLPREWCTVLVELAAAPLQLWRRGRTRGPTLLSQEHYEALVAKHLGFDRLDQELRPTR